MDDDDDGGDGGVDKEAGGEESALEALELGDVIQLSDLGREAQAAGVDGVSDGPLLLTTDFQYGKVFGKNVDGTLIDISQDNGATTYQYKREYLKKV